MKQENELNTSTVGERKILKLNVRKIVMSEEIQQKATMILSKYHPKLLLDGKSKPDELLSMVITEAIEYFYNNKLLAELQNIK